MSINDEATNRNKDKHFSVDNSDYQDSKAEESAKTTTTIDITKASSTSKDILDITDTPDVAVWNKSVQIKSDVTNQSKHSKERDNGETQTTGFGFRKGRRKEDDEKDSAIIDPANQKDIDDVVNSGCTLTDKA